MRILVNGVNLKAGGGVTVIMNFLKSVIDYSEFHKHEYHVMVPSNVGYEKFNQGPIKIEIIPEAMKSPLKRLWLDFTWLKKRIELLNPDVIFTMGNIAIPTDVKQGVLFMYPYAIYPKNKKVWDILDYWTRLDLRFRNKIFKRRLKYADIIFPQTKTSKKRLLQYYGSSIKKIEVVPTAYSKIDSGELKVNFFKKEKDCIYLMCLTKYYKHKNLEIFIPLAKLIKKNKSSIRIITTVEKNQGPGSEEFLNKLREQQLEDIVINIGKIPFERVPALYQQIDGLLLPTLLESFSATYADSMTLKVPVFTSNRDFARDVCGDAGIYFDPLNAQDIYDTITQTIKSNGKLNEKIKIGFERASRFPGWYDVIKKFLYELESLLDK